MKIVKMLKQCCIARSKKGRWYQVPFIGGEFLNGLQYDAMTRVFPIIRNGVTAVYKRNKRGNMARMTEFLTA